MERLCTSKDPAGISGWVSLEELFNGVQCLICVVFNLARIHERILLILRTVELVAIVYLVFYLWGKQRCEFGYISAAIPPGDCTGGGDDHKKQQKNDDISGQPHNDGDQQAQGEKNKDNGKDCCRR